MSDCDKCWGTPCECGWDYETWSTERIAALRDVLAALVARRDAGEMRRRGSWEPAYGPQPKLTAADFAGTLTLDPKDIEPR